MRVFCMYRIWKRIPKKEKATLTRSGYIGFLPRHSPLLVIYSQFGILHVWDWILVCFGLGLAWLEMIPSSYIIDWLTAKRESGMVSENPGIDNVTTMAYGDASSSSHKVYNVCMCGEEWMQKYDRILLENNKINLILVCLLCTPYIRNNMDYIPTSE